MYFLQCGGSGDFAASSSISITGQIEQQIASIRQKRPVNKFIAYFQAYTNTYAPVDYLREIFTEALSHPAVAALSIGTRPDCLGPDVLELLEELNRRKPVWVELGLQTIHEKTAAYIRRGYPLSCFERPQRSFTGGIWTVLSTPFWGFPARIPRKFWKPWNISTNFPSRESSCSCCMC